jgi:hypothetical protein
MGEKLSYVARRGEPLTARERRAVDRIIEHYSVVEEIDAFAEMGRGANWESFVVFDPADPSGPDVVFEGATYVRDHPPDHALAVLRHWCAALSALRHALPGATWDVTRDGLPVRWAAGAETFDPSVVLFDPCV